MKTSIIIFYLAFFFFVFECRTQTNRCSYPKDPGPCTDNYLRYYYDSYTYSCKPFVYGGCQGNSNRFAALEDCKSICESFLVS